MAANSKPMKVKSHRWILIGAVALFAFVLRGSIFVSDLTVNLQAVLISHCLLNSTNAQLACQSIEPQASTLSESIQNAAHLPISLRGNIAIGHYAAINNWPADRSPNNLLDAYWLGVAYAKIDQPEKTLALWQSANLPSQVPLLFLQDAHTANDEEQLKNWVELAQQLIPLRGSDLRPYPDLDEYTNDLSSWGYPLLAADVQQLIADHESRDNIHYWYATAEVARLRGNLTQTIGVLLQARSIWPDDELLRTRLIQAYLGGDQPNMAQQIAASWIQSQPANSSSLYWGAQAAYRAKDFPKVQQWCKQLIAMNLKNNLQAQCEQWLKEIP